MTPRERVLLALQHQEADRIPIMDSLWGTTVQRWRSEGMPEEPVPAQFGWELEGIGGDDSLQLPTACLEETDTYRITRGSDGGVVKNWIHQSSTPEIIDFTVKTREDWEAVRPRMVWNDTRLNWESVQKTYEDIRRRGLFCFASFYIGFTRTCDMCGTETVLMAMLEDPEWVQDMFMTRAQMCVRMAEEMLQHGIDCDGGWIWDDLGFKQRRFFKPSIYSEILMPAHRVVCDFFKSRGKYMILHSCGYVMELVPLIIETGFDCLQPIEVKAGNDVIALKQQYGGRLAIMGGIDVRAMADPDSAVIEMEIAHKIPLLKQGGGYIYHSDHSIPDNVSFQQYQRVQELVEYYGRYK